MRVITSYLFLLRLTIVLALSFSQLKTELIVNATSLLLMRLTYASTVPIEPLEAQLEQLERFLPTHSQSVLFRKIGSLHLLLGNETKALEILSQGTQLYPYDTLLALELGDAFAIFEKYDQALFFWRQAGVSAQYLAMRGLTYHAQAKQLDESKRIVLASELWPEWSNAWFEIGGIYGARNERENAVMAYTKAIEVNHWTPPISGNASRYSAHLYLGFLHNSLGNYAKGYLHFAACSQLAQSNPSYYNRSELARIYKMMGVLSQLQGNSPLAISHLQQSISFVSDDIESYYWLSVAERQQKWYDQAITHLLTAISIQNDLPNYYSLLAELYLDVNDKPKAIDALKSALILAPNDQNLRQMLSGLTQQNYE